MKNCALCNAVITDANDSKEHIIPSSIGGRKKIKGFICKPCNDDGGKSSEAELARQFNWLCLYIGVQRESGRGEPPSEVVETVKGEKLLLRPDGTLTPEHPTYEKTELQDRTKYNIVARTTAEAKTFAKGIAKKHPTLTTDQILEKAKFSQTPVDSPISITLEFGGPLVGKSIVKTAFALASASNIPHEVCDLASLYLKGMINEEHAPYNLFYTRDLVRNRPSDKLFHCVSICSGPNRSRSIAYVEYFGIARFVAILGSQAFAEEVNQTYAIDPVTGEEIIIDVNINLTEQEINMLIQNETNIKEDYIKAVNQAIIIAAKINFQRALGNAIKNAAIYAQQTLGLVADEPLAPDQAKIYSDLVAEKVMEFIAQYMNSTSGANN